MGEAHLQQVLQNLIGNALKYRNEDAAANPYLRRSSAAPSGAFPCRTTASASIPNTRRKSLAYSSDFITTRNTAAPASAWLFASGWLNAMADESGSNPNREGRRPSSSPSRSTPSRSFRASTSSWLTAATTQTAGKSRRHRIPRPAAPLYTAGGSRFAMHTPKHVTEDVLDFLRRTDTCTVANAIETFDVRMRNEGFIHGVTKCMFPELAPVAGYAAPGRIRTSAPPIAELCYYHRATGGNMSPPFPSPTIIVHSRRRPRPRDGRVCG